MNYIEFRIFIVFLSSIFFLSSWQGVKRQQKVLPDGWPKQIGWNFPFHKMGKIRNRGHAEHLSNQNDYCLHRENSLTGLWSHPISRSFSNSYNVLQS